MASLRLIPHMDLSAALRRCGRDSGAWGVAIETGDGHGLIFTRQSVAHEGRDAASSRRSGRGLGLRALIDSMGLPRACDRPHRIRGGHRPRKG